MVVFKFHSTIFKTFIVTSSRHYDEHKKVYGGSLPTVDGAGFLEAKLFQGEFLYLAETRIRRWKSDHQMLPPTTETPATTESQKKSVTWSDYAAPPNLFSAADLAPRSNAFSRNGEQQKIKRKKIGGATRFPADGGARPAGPPRAAAAAAPAAPFQALGRLEAEVHANAIYRIYPETQIVELEFFFWRRTNEEAVKHLAILLPNKSCENASLITLSN